MKHLLPLLLILSACYYGKGQMTQGGHYYTTGRDKNITDTGWHWIQSGCFFTFPSGHTITCDSLYKLFQQVSEYENRLDSLILEMRSPRHLSFSIPVPPGTIGWTKWCDTCSVRYFGFYDRYHISDYPGKWPLN